MLTNMTIEEFLRIGNAAKSWNNIPWNIKEINPMPVFKKYMTAYLRT